MGNSYTHTEEALVAAEPDYRALQPEMVTDPNGNRAKVSFDTRGSSPDGITRQGGGSTFRGGSFDTFTTDLTPAQRIPDCVQRLPRKHGSCTPNNIVYIL
jgi:hypothetical protein